MLFDFSLTLEEQTVIVVLKRKAFCAILMKSSYRDQAKYLKEVLFWTMVICAALGGYCTPHTTILHQKKLDFLVADSNSLVPNCSQVGRKLQATEQGALRLISLHNIAFAMCMTAQCHLCLGGMKKLSPSRVQTSRLLLHTP